MGKSVRSSNSFYLLNNMKTILVVISVVLVLVDAEPCKSVRGQECLRRDSLQGTEFEWQKKFAGGDYCFKMFGSSVCLVDDWKPRLVIQCECSNPECDVAILTPSQNLQRLLLMPQLNPPAHLHLLNVNLTMATSV